MTALKLHSLLHSPLHNLVPPVERSKINNLFCYISNQYDETEQIKTFLLVETHPLGAHWSFESLADVDPLDCVLELRVFRATLRFTLLCPFKFDCVV